MSSSSAGIQRIDALDKTSNDYGIKIKKNMYKNLAIANRSRAEDISVTLKSRLRVTQGHWKRNHWVDHTRHTISRVI